MNKGLIVHTVIFNDKNEVLITRRASTDDFLPEHWDIPGGTLEDGEDPQIGAIREAKEETNLDVQEPCLFFQKSNIDTGKNKQFVTLVFLAKYSGGEIVLDQRSHDEYKWINISDLAKYKTVDFLADCLNSLASRKHPLLSY
ncbi:MAG: NUDIX hydrolase [bacterium]|nr:NUDIX hydrolase [bacterium]